MESKASSAAPPTPVAAEPPTTYVQADPATFRDLVQRLTGAPASKPSAPAVGPRRQAFKLHDRRGSSVSSLDIKLRLASIKSPGSNRSPVSTLVSDPVFSPPAGARGDEEERAIKEKGYYLHPSPRGSATPPPELLTLFPLCSPKQQQQEGGREERDAVESA